MTLLYGRSVRLTVGPPGRQGLAFPGDLRITFDIVRDVDREPNTASIDILNLTRDSRSALEEEGAIAVLEAGYGQNLFRLFTGEVVRVEHTPNGTDVTTRIECDDGNREYTGQISVYVGPGTFLSDALEQVADAMGLTLRLGGYEASDIVMLTPLVRGYSYTGPGHRALTELLGLAGATWSIQNRTIEILAPEGGVTESIPLVTPDTGLIGWAVKARIDNGRERRRGRGRRRRGETAAQRRRRQEREKAPGVKFQSLIAHNYHPGGRVQVRSRDVDGVFRILRVRFNGDSNGGDFLASVEALE